MSASVDPRSLNLKPIKWKQAEHSIRGYVANNQFATISQSLSGNTPSEERYLLRVFVFGTTQFTRHPNPGEAKKHAVATLYKTVASLLASESVKEKNNDR